MGADGCSPSATAPPSPRRSSALFDVPAELARVRSRALRAHARLHLAARRRAAICSSARRWARPERRPRGAAMTPRASSLPELRLDHLLRLTDDTGIIQHATFSVPSRASGYCVDDNARALIVALHAEA